MENSGWIRVTENGSVGRAEVSAQNANSEWIPFSYLDNIPDEKDPQDYRNLNHKPSINGVELVGDQSTESLGIDSIPSGGTTGDILTRIGEDGTEWLTPANHAEEDNTRPITAAAVYTEIGNINALLESI